MATASIFTPYVAATINGVAIPGVRKARVINAFSDPVAKIYVTAYPSISWSEGDTITVTMGSGTNNVLSATGQIYEADYLNSGPTFELVARGPLFKAQKYKNNVTGGLTLVDLTGGPATDEVIARAVLTIAGVSFTAGNIGGTGIERGRLAPSAYTWRQGETALDYLNRLTKASLGYRMVETVGGDVRRVQVFGRPLSTASYTLTQGVDIFGGGHTQYDAFGRYTAVTVTGFDYSDGNGAVSFTDPNPLPAGVDAFVYSSEMIERGLESDPGSGISAVTVARNFVEPEVDRVAIRVSGIRTPRDDPFTPGQTHQIDASWLGLSNELLWCMSVTRECDGKWFAQTMDYLGGGTATPDVPPEGRSTFEAALPPPGRRRMRDYTYLHQVDRQLIGLDLMVPGQRSIEPRARRIVGAQQQFDRSHGGILGGAPTMP